MRRERVFLRLAVAVAAAVAPGVTAHAQLASPEPVKFVYFDPHNHITGILPAHSFANLPKFIASFSDPSKHIDKADLEELYAVLQKWYTEGPGKGLGDQLYSPIQRYGLGGRATLVVYKTPASEDELRGAIDRILTSTPWTEFDSGYMFRGDPVENGMPGSPAHYGGGPVEQYVRQRHYRGNAQIAAKDICTATVLELAGTGVHRSEQSINFIGGWKFKNDSSARLQSILCYAETPGSQELKPVFEKMQVLPPVIKFLLMSHTTSLAQIGLPFTMSTTCPSGALNVGFGSWLIGFSNPNVPVDFIFGPGQAPGCNIYSDFAQDLDLLFAFTAGASSFSKVIPVPANNALCGIVIFTQAACFVPSANPLGVITSNGRTQMVGL